LKRQETVRQETLTEIVRQAYTVRQETLTGENSVRQTCTFRQETLTKLRKASMHLQAGNTDKRKHNKTVPQNTQKVVETTNRKERITNEKPRKESTRPGNNVFVMLLWT
jgi:hypothetical protein